MAGRVAAVVLLAAAVTMLPDISALAKTQPETGTIHTLSLRTGDGLVVVEAPQAELARVKNLLRSEASPPETNRSLFLWLIEHGSGPDSVRLYASSDEKIHRSSGHSPSSRWQVMTVEQAVRSGKVPDIGGLRAFEAYMLLRSSGFRVFLDKTSISNTALPFTIPHTVFVLSSSWGNGYHGIFVDGHNLSKGINGYNIVILTPDGEKVAAAESFNLFSGPGHAADMAEFLNSQQEGSILLASVKMGPGVFFSGAVLNALQRYGANENPNPQVLSSHAIIGKKGLAPGGAAESAEVNLGTNLVYFDNSLFIDPAQAGSIVAPGAAAVVLSGTGADTTINVYGDM